MILVKTGRRGFLRNLGGATFAASTMRFFLSSAEAQVFPKRFLFVFTNAGRDATSRCTGTGAGYTLGAGYAPLERHKNKVLILDGIQNPPHTGEEHPCGKASLLTGRKASSGNWKAAGQSIDRYLANKLTAGVSFFTGTFNGPGSGDVGVNPVSWNGPNAANDAFLKDSGAFISKFFSGAAPTPPPAPTPSPTPSPTPGPSPQSVRNQNEFALYDYLMKDVEKLRGIAPTAERERLAKHVEALKQIQSGFAPTGTGGTGGGTGGTGGTTPPEGMVTRQCGNSVDLAGASNETDKVSLAIANAFACDRARIGVVRFGTEDPYHNYSHWRDGSDYLTKMRQMDLQYSQNFANLLGYLDSFKEGTGTVLDNTLVIWGSDCCGEFGVGQQGGEPLPGDAGEGDGIHNTRFMPYVLAGSLGGKVKTGQRIVSLGRTNVDLFRTIAQTMGAGAAADFGEQSYFKGVLSDILV